MKTPNDSSTIGNISANPAAFTSKLSYYSTPLINGKAYANSQILMQNVIPVNPNNPYFYIFSNSGIALDFTNAALLTKAEFLNGGVPVSDMEFYWGDDEILDINLSAPVLSVQIGGAGGGWTLSHDPSSGSCGFTTPGTDNLGVLARWTSICDSIRLTTTWLYAGIFNGTETLDVSIFHGLLQQIWN